MTPTRALSWGVPLKRLPLFFHRHVSDNVPSATNHDSRDPVITPAGLRGRTRFISATADG